MAASLVSVACNVLHSLLTFHALVAFFIARTHTYTHTHHPTHPNSTLIIYTTCAAFWMNVCERAVNVTQSTFLSSIWLVIITGTIWHGLLVGRCPLLLS